MTDSDPETPEQRLAAARSWAAQLNAPQAASSAPSPRTPAAPAPAQAAPSDPSGPPDLEPEAAQMSDRLQTVMGAVERAADAIRADAEEQARQHLAEAQEKADRMTAERVRMISELTDDLIEHASIVRDHSEQMVAALERAINGVSGKLAEIGESDPEAPAIASSTPSAAGSEASPAAAEAGSGKAEAGAATVPPETPPETAEEPSAEILLRATQLAIAGESRETIGERLRADFGIEPEPVLKQVLG